MHARVHVVICNIKGLRTAVLNLFGFLIEHLNKNIFSILHTLLEIGKKKGKWEEENSSAKRSFCVVPNNKLETLLQFSCLWVCFLCPLVYENDDVRFKGNVVHVGLLHGNGDSICKVMKYIPVDGLSDVTCQGNE